MTTWAEFMTELEREAKEAGPEAVAELQALREKWRARREHGKVYRLYFDEPSRYEHLKFEVQKRIADGRLPERITAEEKADWAYGNAVLSDSEVTREMADKPSKGMVCRRCLSLERRLQDARKKANDNTQDAFKGRIATRGAKLLKERMAEVKFENEALKAELEALREKSEMTKSKPTSGSWAKDAEALLEMGATRIDADTVRGLLDVIDTLVQRADEVIANAPSYRQPNSFSLAVAWLEQEIDELAHGVGPVLDNIVVSEPGALVEESIVVLSESAKRGLTIKGEIPSHDAKRRKALENLKAMPTEELLALAVRAGIYDEDGNLTPAYGGEAYLVKNDEGRYLRYLDGAIETEPYWTERRDDADVFDRARAEDNARVLGGYVVRKP